MAALTCGSCGASLITKKCPCGWSRDSASEPAGVGSSGLEEKKKRTDSELQSGGGVTGVGAAGVTGNERGSGQRGSGTDPRQPSDGSGDKDGGGTPTRKSVGWKGDEKAGGGATATRPIDRHSDEQAGGGAASSKAVGPIPKPPDRGGQKANKSDPGSSSTQAGSGPPRAGGAGSKTNDTPVRRPAQPPSRTRMPNVPILLSSVWPQVLLLSVTTLLVAAAVGFVVW
jgi:hypothetical protein